MLIIQDLLVSDDVVQEQFLCNLKACKGACCWEGDYGAPIDEEERQLLETLYPKIKPFLRPEGIAVLEKEGLYTYYKEAEVYGTPLIDNAACAYLTYDELGIAKCGIEKAYEAGVIKYKKPLSCHLYPIRVEHDPTLAFEALNYDKWDICKAACQAGKKAKLPVYKFVKEALIRKYGINFYEELDAAAEHLKESQDQTNG